MLWSWLVVVCVGDDSDVGDGGVQKFIHGDEMEEGSQVYRVQNWWRI